jgi:hypothetical protein
MLIETKTHSPAARVPDATRVHYRTANVDGIKIFYREAGDPGAPAILLLHGFPSSSPYSGPDSATREFP